MGIQVIDNFLRWIASPLIKTIQERNVAKRAEEGRAYFDALVEEALIEVDEPSLAPRNPYDASPPPEYMNTPIESPIKKGKVS